jgi:L-alanine-DL-glutamate epimerase-like enolase superfamily enzyme
MKITDVEVLVLRQPEIQYISDSTQDASIVLVHTDAGITGIGDTDSAPLAVKACIEMPGSHYFCRGLREILIGADPLDIEGLWDKKYRFSLWYERRGVAASLHLNAVLPNYLFQEFCQADTPLNRDGVQERFAVRDGYLDVPDAPGLGVTLNEDVVRTYRVA